MNPPTPERKKCPTCKGEKSVLDKVFCSEQHLYQACPTCKGTGLAKEAETLQTFAKKVEGMMCNLMQMVNTLQNEWKAENCWSEWDEETVSKARAIQKLAFDLSHSKGDQNAIR